MTENEKVTTLSLRTEDADVFRKLSAKSHIDLIYLMHEIAKEIDTMLEDGIEESDRISFMASADLATSQVKLYFAPIFTQLNQLPKPIQDYYRKLKAREDAELRGKKA
jgi:hypothetical protein